VPELGERLPDLPLASPLEPVQARFRLFESLTRFLQTAALAQSLVLVLDDLHWADRPSLLLEFLAHELRACSMLVVGAYRDVEVDRSHAPTHTLAELARQPAVERLVLRGLSAPEVGEFIHLSLGLRLMDKLAGAIHQQTEGNPFFVAQLVRLLASEGRLAVSAELPSRGLA
jgi:predicted ATPase